MGKFRRLSEPIRLQDLLNSARSRTEKKINAGYVKVAPGKPQTGPLILKISLGTREAKFSLGEEKKSTG